jgi:hypothetical protein
VHHILGHCLNFSRQQVFKKCNMKVKRILSTTSINWGRKHYTLVLCRRRRSEAPRDVSFSTNKLSLTIETTAKIFLIHKTWLPMEHCGRSKLIDVSVALFCCKDYKLFLIFNSRFSHIQFFFCTSFGLVHRILTKLCWQLHDFKYYTSIFYHFITDKKRTLVQQLRKWVYNLRKATSGRNI